jgi:LacI family sucrose operon transcriptional repressor
MSNDRKKKVTFSDIAKYTHFSKTTISRYFNHPETVTEENKKIIEEALQALDYHENKLAKVLANGKTEFIGIIIPNLSMHYYAELLSQIISTYDTFGYKFLVFESQNDQAKELQYIDELMAYNIEGLIMISHYPPSEILSRYPIPIVTIERESQFVSGVTTNNYNGAILATKHLADIHNDIYIHINSKLSENNPDYYRTKGFIDQCQRSDLPYDLRLQHLGNGFEEMNAIYTSLFEDFEKRYKGKKKGIFVCNDTHANILLNIIYRHYGCLPADYNIVGFDDSSIAREAIIPITTIHQDIKGLAIATMKIIIKEIEATKQNKAIQHTYQRVEPTLLIRKTTHQ